MHARPLGLFGCVLLLGAFGVGAPALFLHYDERASEFSTYVGSRACDQCHDGIYESWRSSLHAKMIRPVEAESSVVADLSPDHADIPFDPARAVWALGSKWEQQFMGEEDGKHTLLPGVWRVNSGEWVTKSWDGWRTPDPSVRCNGCHMVGLEVETGAYEEIGIGCESCHGASSWHAQTRFGWVSSSLDSQVCGQCHTRGMTPDQRFFFPVGYQPGRGTELQDHFRQLEPDYLQNSSFWWANGRERKRHQQYYAWQQGGHSESLKSLTVGYDGRFGEIDEDCLTCHSGEAAILGRDHGLSIGDVRFGVECAVCHNIHGELDHPRVECASCHPTGAFYHATESNEGHVACPEVAEVSCIDCHMPRTIKNSGEYQLRSHRRGIIEPSETAEIGIPNTCMNSGCHAEVSLSEMQSRFDRHYRGEAVRDGGRPTPMIAVRATGVPAPHRSSVAK